MARKPKRKTFFKVSMYLPDNYSEDEMKNYIEEAVGFLQGGGHPDEMFNIKEANIVVTKLKKGG